MKMKIEAIILACLSWCLVELRTSVVAFAAPDTPSSAIGSSGSSTGTAEPQQQSSSSCDASSTSTVLDTKLAIQRIKSGRVYVHRNFLSEAQLSLLQRDMKQLEDDGKFVVNGLSDVRKGLKGEPTTAAGGAGGESNQGFHVKYDRSVCPIPWWKDALTLPLQYDNVDFEKKGISENEMLLLSIQNKLQRLRFDLSKLLERPTMMNDDLGHECYYSQSAPGSSLARHMDERHEETKGPRGWLLPSRRSLSWLIYLSETDNHDDEWDGQLNGGLLRTFPQRLYRNTGSSSSWQHSADCSSHNGNLQVGWILASDNDGAGKDDNKQQQYTHPVFLDSWYDHINPYTGITEPHCVLYIVRSRNELGNNDDGDDNMRIEYITVPWSIDALGGGNVADFIQHRAMLESSSNAKEATELPSLFLQKSHAKQFRLLEDRNAWTRGEEPAGSKVEDILPSRGTLVVFDSVSLPHEVTAVIKGKRAALAGWFHEETQPLGGNV